MSLDPEFRPQLRPVEVAPTEHKGRKLLALHDPTGWAEGVMTVSEPTLFILSKFDGEHTLAEIQAEFIKASGQMILTEQLEGLVRQLDEQHFLESPAFEAYLGGLADAYRAAPARQTMPDSGIGCELHQVPLILSQVMASGSAGANGVRVVGLIAPHLDFRRGATCYADAYKPFEGTSPPRRFILLGTNHFGRSMSVVATNKDFQTPLGTATTDRALIERLNARLGANLCEHELDHKREHSIEMQVLFLQHCFYDKPFSIVPVLCPDPCGPTGTKPFDGDGVDLKAFAEALGEEIAADPASTCIIAGADLSHVGRRFGDERELDEPFLKHVEERDQKALKHVTAREPEAFCQLIAGDDNSTRICSAGSIFTLMTALERAYGLSRVGVDLLRYHQAVDKQWETCVTCAAVAFTLMA